MWNTKFYNFYSTLRSRTSASLDFIGVDENNISRPFIFPSTPSYCLETKITNGAYILVNNNIIIEKNKR